MITASDLFYSVDDVMRILDYSRAQSYKIIANLNDELKKQGYEVRSGLVSQRYFMVHERNMLIRGKVFRVSSIFSSESTHTPTEKMLSLIDAELSKECHGA